MAAQDLNDLLALMAVARERSFTRAAAQLGVSQSALSRTVRALEQKMGLLLLTRTTSAWRRPKRVNGCSANQYVWPKLKPLLLQYPDIQVELINDYGLSNIVAKRYDIGVRLGDQIERDMIAVRIAPDETLAIVGSPSYLDGRPEPQVPRDLTSHNCINLRLPTRDALMPWELRKGRKQVDVKVGGQLVFNNTYQMLEATLGGFGLAYLPRALVEPFVQEGRLQFVLEEWHPTFTGHHAYYPARQSSLAVRLVIEALRVGRGR